MGTQAFRKAKGGKRGRIPFRNNGWLASVDGPADVSVDYTYDAVGKPDQG